MSNPSSDSFRNALRHMGQDYSFAPRYIRGRDPNSPTNASNDIKPKEQQGYYPTGSFWTNSTNGNLWALQKITANLANWILLSTGTVGPLLSIPVPNGTTPVVPTTGGAVSFTSSGGSITITGGTNSVNFDLAGGGVALDSIAVQATTAPGITPVAPTAAGLVTMNGAAVAAHSVPIETRSRALNALNVEVQYATTSATTDATKSGLLHAFASQFSIDANGFLQLVGGSGAAVQKVNVDASTAPGTDPVLADGSGQIVVTGAQVAAGVVGTNVIRSDSLAANTYTMEIQRSTTAATTTLASNGVSHYKSADFTVDANAFVALNPIALPVGVANLGITYVVGTGTFSVTSADGSALSATNPASVWMQDSAAPGKIRKYTITANQSFIDDNGASQIIGNLFGLTTGIICAQTMPFFLYACSNDAQDTITFGISRIPHMKVAPAVGNIGTPASPVADTQGSIFLFSSVTVADYDANPVLCVGSFLMTMSVADDWTVSTLTTKTGIGQFQDGIEFGVPRGHFGATTGKYFKNNGGTAFDDADGGYAYEISRDGKILSQIAFPTMDTAGVGAVNAILATPFLFLSGGNSLTGYVITGGGTFVIIAEQNPGASETATIRYNSAASTPLLNSDLGIGNRFSAYLTYCAQA